MKLIYAKFWLRKFIKYNHKLDDKTFSHNLNRHVINLSHRVFKSRGFRGHNTRQEIRRQLQDFVEIELKKYDKKWVVKSPNHGALKPVRLSILSRIIQFLRRRK